MDTLTGDQSDRAKLVEALFYGYRALGFDTDDCKHGKCFLAHTGPGGNNLDSFIALMKRSFDEARADHEKLPALTPEFGVRYDTHVDWIERPAANEAWARTIYNENKDEGAIAVVHRSVTEWEEA